MADSSERASAAREPVGRAGRPRALARFFDLLGPGFITGASDDDPSSVGTATVAGASYGYATLWVAALAFPMMAVSQYLAAKAGLVAGDGVSRLLKKHFSSKLFYTVVLGLVIANTITIGADLAAVAAAANMFVPLPIGMFMTVAALTMAALVLFCSYRQVTNTFKWLALFLFLYVVAALLARPDPGQLLKGTVIPAVRWDKNFLAICVAILGSSVTPYMFFWQSSEEVEEQRAAGRTSCWRHGTCETDLKYALRDVTIGMAFTQVVEYFMIVAAAATLFVAGERNVQTATQAAAALRPLAGRGAAALFAAGLIGSGFLAIPVLAATNAYAIGDVFGWHSSLNARPAEAKPFYGVIIASMLCGLTVNFIGWNPIAALVWASVANACLAPPLLVLLLVITNNKRLMAGRTNSLWVNILGWASVAAISAACVALVLTSLL